MPRAYPLDRVCCALAYLATLSSTRARTEALRVIAAQLGSQYAATVRAAWASRRDAVPDSGGDRPQVGPD